MEKLGRGKDNKKLYTHIVNSGIVEAVTNHIVKTSTNSETKYISTQTLEGIIVGRILQFLEMLNKNNITGPYIAIVSLWGMKDVALNHNASRGGLHI